MILPEPGGLSVFAEDHGRKAVEASLRLGLFRQFAVDELLEGGERLGADDDAAVDEEGGRAGGAEAGALRDVAGDRLPVFAAVEAPGEALAVELKFSGVLF